MSDVAALSEAEQLLAEVKHRPRRFDPYPDYEPTGISWFKQLPEGWNLVRGKWLVKGCQNGIWGSEPNGEDDIACVRVADFDRTTLRVNDDIPTRRAVTLNERRGRQLAQYDLLLEKSGGGELQPVGAVMLFDHKSDAVCSNFVARMPVARGNYPRFLAYMHAHLYSRRVNTRSIKQTTGIQNLDSRQYLDEFVAQPPLDEQRAIARFLDRETAKIDSLVAKKRRLIELLGEKRTALISHAVTKGLNPDAPTKPSGIDWLGDVPKHWEFKKLGFLVSMRGGMTPSKGNDSYWKGTIPWVSPKDMKFREIVDSEDHISESALEDTNLVLFEPPVVLMVVRGMILAHTFPVAITRVPVTVNQDMKALTPKADCNEEYLLNLLNGLSRVILGTVDDSAHGTKVLRLPVWKHVGIFMPDQSEQAGICCHIQHTLHQFDGLIKKVESAIDRLNEYRSALISAAVTGQIDVRKEIA